MKNLQAKNNLSADEEVEPEDQFAHVPARLVLGAGMAVIRVQPITADLLQPVDQGAEGKEEQ